jgi:hypothetical protein
MGLGLGVASRGIRGLRRPLVNELAKARPGAATDLIRGVRTSLELHIKDGTRGVWMNRLDVCSILEVNLSITPGMKTNTFEALEEKGGRNVELWRSKEEWRTSLCRTGLSGDMGPRRRDQKSQSSQQVSWIILLNPAWILHGFDDSETYSQFIERYDRSLLFWLDWDCRTEVITGPYQDRERMGENAEMRLNIHTTLS